MKIRYSLAFHNISHCFAVSGIDRTIYENWRCNKCHSTPGFTYCRWEDQFHSDGGCLPNVPDGDHVPCGGEAGDVVVEDCQG